MVRSILFSFFILIIASIPAFGGWFGPSSYEDCILESMQGVTSKIAAYEIRKACHRKFPEQTQRWNEEKPVPVNTKSETSYDLEETKSSALRVDPSQIEEVLPLATKSIKGWIDSESSQIQLWFDGCKPGRVILFEDGSRVTCKELYPCKPEDQNADLIGDKPGEPFLMGIDQTLYKILDYQER